MQVVQKLFTFLQFERLQKMEISIIARIFAQKISCEAKTLQYETIDC